MKSRKFTSVLLCFILLIGLSLLLYPTISDQWNSYHQSQVILHHAENVAKMSEEECEALRREAAEFNKNLLTSGTRWSLTDEEREKYNKLLITDETEIIAHIEIPKIKVDLPIYHGTSAAVLQNAVGHLEGSSLPVGGAGTHCVLSGHRGLPSATLFTNIDKLTEGDTFMIYTLNEILTYEVDQIRVVLPSDLSTLKIDSDKDYCTLFTCTPYGINTHRLMVRGHRVETVDSHQTIVLAEALQISQTLVAFCIAAPILILLFFITVLRPNKKKKNPV